MTTRGREGGRIGEVSGVVVGEEGRGEGGIQTESKK